MKWLDGILSDIENNDDLANQIKKGIGENFVPNHEYKKKTTKIDELEGELEAAQEQLEQTNSKVKELQQQAEGKEELQEKLEEINQEYTDYKEKEQDRIKKIKKKSAFEKDLISDNVPPDVVDLLVNDVDMDEIELDEEEKIKDAEEIKGKLKEKRPSLFGKKKLNGDDPPDGDPPAPKDNPFKKDSLNLTKQGELVKKEPEKAKRLIKAAGKEPANYGL